MNPTVRKIGWAYVCYHVVLFLLGAYDAVSKYWRIGDLLGELAVGFIFFPVLAPALTLCGGVHDRCASAAGRTVQLLAPGLVVCWAIIGWRVALSAAWRWARGFRAVDQ